MTLGDIIQEYMDLHGISARQFAKNCGLSNTYISGIIKGHSTRGNAIVPSIDTYKAIAGAMGMTADELIRKVDDLISVEPDDRPTLSEGDRMLFRALKGSTEEEKKQAARIIEAMRH